MIGDHEMTSEERVLAGTVGHRREEISGRIPDELERIARNFWWCWNPGVRGLFEELAPGFERAGENVIVDLSEGVVSVGPPPRATVQARLAKPEWKIEIVVTAAI